MQQPRFYGEFKLKVDPKCRMTVPTKLRKQISVSADGLVLIALIGRNESVWLYPQPYFETLKADGVNRKWELSTFSAKGASFAFAVQLVLDKQGRVVLPENFVQQAYLYPEVALIGVGDHLEIWNRMRWEQFQEEAQHMKYMNNLDLVSGHQAEPSATNATEMDQTSATGLTPSTIERQFIPEKIGVEWYHQEAISQEFFDGCNSGTLTRWMKKYCVSAVQHRGKKYLHIETIRWLKGCIQIDRDGKFQRADGRDQRTLRP